MSKQHREDQYRPVTGVTPPDRRAPKLNPGQPVSSSQGHDRGRDGGRSASKGKNQ